MPRREGQSIAMHFGRIIGKSANSYPGLLMTNAFTSQQLSLIKLFVLISLAVGVATAVPVYTSASSTTVGTSAEDLAPLATALDVNHHHLLRSTTQFVERSGMATREDLGAQLDTYRHTLQKLDAHLEVARAVQSGLADETSLDVGGSSDAVVISRVIKSIEKLIHNGEPTLIYSGLLIEWIEPGDTQALVEIRSTLYALGDDINNLELAAVDYSEYISHSKAAQKLKLKRQLNTAYILIGVVFIGLFIVALLYLRNKHRSAVGLKIANEKLQTEVNASAQLTSELEYLSAHDVLSGVLNRRGFMQSLDEVLDQSDSKSGLCFLDLDLFKIVNDTAGHAAGDELIRQIAQTLSSVVTPQGASVARFGGDEFLILLPDCNWQEFEGCVNLAHEVLSPFNFCFEDRHFTITGSLGAVFFVAGAHDSHSLLTAVDTACYEAKRAGGGRVHFSNDDSYIIESRRHDVEWVNRINEALREDLFCLYYQPIVETAIDKEKDDHVVHSWEILIRMLDAGGNIVSPAEFLDIAERYSLATRVDRWVVNHVFEWLSGNRQVLEQVGLININLSGKTVGDAQFLTELESKAAECGVPSEAICFEITETASIGDHAIVFLQRLKELGFKLALDDFGSGFSSFGYLEILPVDYLKLDGKFVRDIDSNDTHREFVRAIHAVGKSMNKLTVAEFVENAESLQVLQELGVDFIQGYHIAKPGPLPDRRLKNECAARRVA